MSRSLYRTVVSFERCWMPGVMSPPSLTVHEREEWQTVMEVLLSAVEGREPVRLVQVALTLALQESEPMRRPRRKPAKK